MTEQAYTVDHVTDEFGNDRWFVANPNGDWVGDGVFYDPANREAAYEEARRMNEIHKVAAEIKAGNVTFEQAVQGLLG